MIALLAIALAAAPALPPECEPPATRDVAPLSKLAKLDGTLSAGLDSVATWCFDSGGAWTAGLKPKQGVPPKQSEPVGECKKAVAACESAQAALLAQAEWRALASAALGDLDRPFRGQRYPPKRTGLRETPNDAADCSARARADLFAQAQARMDLARLEALIQSEYANYKTWLYKKGLECRNEVNAAKKDPTRASVAVDKPNAPALPPPRPAEPEAKRPAVAAVAPQPGEAADAGAGSAQASKPAGADADAGPAQASRPAGAEADRGRAVSIGLPLPAPAEPPAERAPGTGTGRDSELEAMLSKWKAFAARQSEHEKDRDYTLGFLASRELRACRCSRVNAAAVVRALENREGGETGLALLRADDAANTRCIECALDAFGPWRSRASKQCALVDGLTDYEISRLGASDDANGIPPRCFDDVSRARAARAPADAGRPVVALPAAQPQVATVRPMAPPQPAAGGTQPAAGPRPQPQPAAPASPGGAVATAPQPGGSTTTAASGPHGPPLTGPGVAPQGYDPFVPPSAPAPAIPREDGRMYVRLSMSATCTAEINPGPIQARTGDLLLVPFAARQLSVKSPCGGLAEIYWGREPRPRVSEVFGRNQPLVFNFKAQ